MDSSWSKDIATSWKTARVGSAQGGPHFFVSFCCSTTMHLALRWCVVKAQQRRKERRLLESTVARVGSL